MDLVSVRSTLLLQGVASPLEIIILICLRIQDAYRFRTVTFLYYTEVMAGDRDSMKVEVPGFHCDCS